MAFLDCNSFQYDQGNWTGSGTRTAGAGQSGLPSIRHTSGSNLSTTYGFAPALSELITGFCHRRSDGSSSGQIFEIWGGGTRLFRLTLTAAGTIVATNASDTNVGTSASGLFAQNVEAYIELRWKNGAATGEVEVHLNGDPTPIINVTGVNTNTIDANELRFASNGADGTRDYSAWYFLDTTAATWVSGADDDFLGHIRFAALDPTGNGASSDLVGSDADSTDNYLLVDDGGSSISHDSDTTYVQSSVVGDFDTYDMEDMPTPPLLVYAVVPVVIAKKTDAGTRGVTPVIRSGGTDYDASTEYFLSTTYTSKRQAISEDPDTAVAWDEAGINAMELGVKVTT